MRMRRMAILASITSSLRSRICSLAAAFSVYNSHAVLAPAASQPAMM
jgi:hypothetical protein